MRIFVVTRAFSKHCYAEKHCIINQDILIYLDEFIQINDDLVKFYCRNSYIHTDAMYPKHRSLVFNRFLDYYWISK